MLRVAGANRHRPAVRSRAHPHIPRTLHAARMLLTRLVLGSYECGFVVFHVLLPPFCSLFDGALCVDSRLDRAGAQGLCDRRNPSGWLAMTLANVITDGVGIAAADLTIATPPSSADGDASDVLHRLCRRGLRSLRGARPMGRVCHRRGAHVCCASAR